MDDAERAGAVGELPPPPLVPPSPNAPLSARYMHMRAWEGIWPKAVCQAVLDEFPDTAFSDATVQTRQGDTLIDPGTRRTKHIFIEPAHWTGALVSHLAHQANLIWRFDLTGLGTLSILRYDEVGSHFTWHVDVLAYDQASYPGLSELSPARPLERKLSVTVNLSDGDDYEGGDLEFVSGSGQLVQQPELRTQGSTVIFPSTLGHRVTPLTRGVRYALVGWMVGPPLR